MRKPMAFMLPATYNFKRRLFFRFFYPVKQKWYALFDRVTVKAAPGIVMKLLPTDLMHGLIAFTGIYEDDLTKRLARQGRKGGLLVDVGANAGYFSLIWAAANPDNKVLAFEASPRNVPLLQENIQTNGLADGITVYPLALSKEQGMLSFDLGPADQTGWGGITLAASNASIEVPVDRLDRLVDEHTVIDVMKVDVEGADTWVIMGAEKLLKNKRIKVIYFEQNKPRLKQLGINEDDAAEYLATVGYVAKPISPTSMDVVDWVAVQER